MSAARNMKTKLQAAAKRGSATRTNSGRDAAVETVQMMQASFAKIPPKKLVKRYNALLRADLSKTELLDTLWAEFGDDTVAVMAMGSRLLARLWGSAWQLGGGDRKIKAGALKPPNLVKCYGKKTFLKSFLLTEIGDHLMGLPPEPK
jgi:hypothetical protein